MSKKTDTTAAELEALTQKIKNQEALIKQLRDDIQSLNAEKIAFNNSWAQANTRAHLLETNLILTNEKLKQAVEGEKVMAGKFLNTEAECKKLKDANQKLEKKLAKFENQNDKAEVVLDSDVEESEEEFTDCVDRAA